MFAILGNMQKQIRWCHKKVGHGKNRNKEVEEMTAYCKSLSKLDHECQEGIYNHILGRG